MEDYICDQFDANYAITISDTKVLKRVVGMLYFNLPETVSCSHMITTLGKYYPEYCEPYYRIDITKVRNGKRYA